MIGNYKVKKPIKVFLLNGQVNYIMIIIFMIFGFDLIAEFFAAVNTAICIFS